VVRFKIIGALRLLDMHAFMAWTKTRRHFKYSYDIMKQVVNLDKRTIQY
jgi:hypothetical protein